MFGGAAFGELAFCEQDHTPLDSDAFEAFLAEVTAARCWLLELDALSLASTTARSAAFGDAGFGEMGFSSDDAGVTGGVQTLRFSSHGYISHASDSPAYTHYDQRIRPGVLVERSTVDGQGLGGLTRVYAQLELDNADGALDTLLANYSIGGRRARILVGRPGDALADFGVEFSGVALTPVIAQQSVRIALSDGSRKLERIANETAYAGTGGVEGGSDLKGKRKPRCYGKVYNVSPPLVDSANLIYQVHDGAINDVPQAYDRGVALTKVAGAPAAGQYQVDTTAGTLKLGATPAGTVTCNVEGDASGSGYTTRIADIVKRILLNQAGLATTEVDSTSFDNLNGAAGGAVGIWLGTEPRACAEVVRELLVGVGAWGGFSRSGAFTVGVLDSPVGVTPSGELTDREIVSVTRLPLPSEVDPVVWRVVVGYQKNYTVQNDFAAAVTAAQRTFAAEPMRTAKQENATIQSRHLHALELGPLPGLYVNESDASAEATRLLNLWGSVRGMYEVKTRPLALNRDIGQVVTLRHPRHGFASGRAARVVGHAVRGWDVTLKVLA